MPRPRLTRYQLAARRKMGGAIRRAREQAVLTQAELAEEIVRSAAERGEEVVLYRQQVSAAERGEISAPPPLRAWLAEQTD